MIIVLWFICFFFLHSGWFCSICATWVKSLLRKIPWSKVSADLSQHQKSDVWKGYKPPTNMSESLHQHIEGQGLSSRALNRSHSFSCLIVIIETEFFRHFISHSFSKRRNKNNIRHSQRMWPWENEIKIKTLSAGPERQQLCSRRCCCRFGCFKWWFHGELVIFSCKWSPLFFIPPWSFRKWQYLLQGLVAGLGNQSRLLTKPDESRRAMETNVHGREGQ